MIQPSSFASFQVSDPLSTHCPLCSNAYLVAHQAKGVFDGTVHVNGKDMVWLSKACLIKRQQQKRGTLCIVLEQLANNGRLRHHIRDFSDGIEDGHAFDLGR